MFWIKSAGLLVVCLISVYFAVYFTDSYIKETAEKQKTVSDVLMANRYQQALADAQESARQELSDNNIVLDDVMEVLETKPPVTEPPIVTEPTSEPLDINTQTLEETGADPNIYHKEDNVGRVTEFRKGGLLDELRAQNPKPISRSLITLTSAETASMMEFLIEHYFFDGYGYAEAELDPEYKEKKLLAADMQNYITRSLHLVMNFLDVADVNAMLNSDFDGLIGMAKSLGDEFESKYANTASYGEEFEHIYNGGLQYFKRLDEALRNFKATADNYHNAANPLLGAMLLASSVDNVLIPEIMGAIESSYDITEACQEIFLDGTTGVWLLTREEVAVILMNPGLIL